MLWLHLARSGKHYGQNTAEELYEICNNWPVKECMTDMWEKEDERHLNDFLPSTHEEALALYEDFGADDYKGGSEGDGDDYEAAAMRGSEGATRAFNNIGGLSKEIQDLVLRAAREAAEAAFSMQSASSKAPGVPTSAIAVARQYGAESVGPDMCVISKQLLAGIVDAMERAREQFESAKHFFDGGKMHFQREVGRFDDALKYLKIAQRRAEGHEEPRDSRASGSAGRAPIGSQSVAPYRRAYGQNLNVHARSPPRARTQHRSRSRGRKF
jgi:hypothetical protein